MERRLPQVRVFSVTVRPAEEHHEIPIYGVEISTDQETWCETFATEIEVNAFTRGLQAGSQMTGGPYLPLPFEIEKLGG